MSKNSKFPKLDKCNPQICISGKMMKCNRIISQIFRKRLIQFGITNSQLSILFFIAKSGSTSQAALAERLFLEKSTVSRNMKRLFENGYVEKDKSQQVRMTDAGNEFLEKIIPEWEKSMKEARKVLKNEGIQALDLIFANLTI